MFNKASIDFLIGKINDNKAFTSKFTKEGENSITRMASNLKKDENEFLSELIQLKSKIDVLMPIDFYLENPKELANILN